MLNNRGFTVIGVAPRDFGLGDQMLVTDAWLPLQMLADVGSQLGQFGWPIIFRLIVGYHLLESPRILILTCVIVDPCRYLFVEYPILSAVADNIFRNRYCRVARSPHSFI